MDGLKAYRINEYETYAGHDMEEAIRVAMEASGCTREETYDDLYAREEGPATRVTTDDGHTTVGEILAAMDGPGPVCSRDY